MNSNQKRGTARTNLNRKTLLLLGVAAGFLLIGEIQAGDNLAAVQAAGQSADQLTTSQSQWAEAKSNLIELKANGKKADQQGMLFDNKTWIPLAFLRDELNLSLTYESASRTYIITQDDQKLKVTLYEGGTTSYLNGHYLGSPDAKLVKGRIYVPFQWLKDYLGYEGMWDGKLKQLDIVKSKLNDLEIKTVSHREDNADAVVTLNVPSVAIPGNPAAEKAINDVLEKNNSEFQAYIDEALKDREANPDLPPYEFNSSYVITYNQKGLLSVLIDKYEYTGGAHGGTEQQSYTFNLEDGSLLTLKDLFGDTSDYMKIINGEIKKGFESHPGYYGGFNGIDSDFAGFYLQTDKVTFFFQLYEYTPYAAGIPEYSISYEKLLKKNSHYQNLLP